MTYNPLWQRKYHLPRQLDAARRKVRALENEARRYGWHDLVEKRG